MKRILVEMIISIIGLVVSVESRNSAVNPERIEELSRIAGTWSPMAYEDNPFKDWTDEMIANRHQKFSARTAFADGLISGLDKAVGYFGFSTKDIGKFMKKLIPDRGQKKAFPAIFDGITKWGLSTDTPNPGCIHPIKDQ